MEEENQQVLKALKQASHDLKSNKSTESNSIKALLELETDSESILSNDPYLSSLSRHLTNLKSIIDNNNNSKSFTRSRHGLRSFLTRRVATHEISWVAGSIESEIQAWIDRESIDNLARALSSSNRNSSSPGSSVDEGNPSSDAGAVREAAQSRVQPRAAGFDPEIEAVLGARVRPL